MEEHQQQESTHRLPEELQVSPDEMLQAKAELIFFPAPHPGCVEVPKYPLRTHDEETEALGNADYKVMCQLLAPRVDSLHGITPEPGYRWESDEVGRTRLLQQIRKLLIEPGDYLTEELANWTLKQILPVLIEARRRADEALRAEQKAQLQEPFELGLLYAARWQQYVRQAVAIVRQFHKVRVREVTSERAPFPEMLDETLAGWRERDMGDVPWMFFVLGVKLEAVFNTKAVFVPGDLYEQISYFGAYIYPNVHHYAAGQMSPDQLNDLWLVIRPFLLAEETRPALVSDTHDANVEHPNAQPEDDGAAISHSDDFRSVTYHGREYTFTRNQAAVVKLLWQQEGGELGQDYILAEIESLAGRLRDVFKQKNGVHPAWGTLIVSGQKRGTFRLNSHEKA